MFTASLVAAFLIADPVKPAPRPTPVAAQAKAGHKVAHVVYFTLKDNSADSRQKLVDLCDTYLAERDGVLFYAAGVRGEAFAREVNDKDWDVGLYIVFKDKAAHDDYEKHPEHLKFIEAGKANWAKVRVFDGEITSKGKPKK
jgi:hypothetical protein